MWEGIAAREVKRRNLLLGRLERLFAQRSFQSAAAVVVLLGVALGFAKAHSKQAAIEKRRLAEARLNYLEWVSPFALLGSLDDTGESE